MRREWTIWLGFTAAVLFAVVFVVVRDSGKDNPAQLSAGTSLPTSTSAPPTTVTTLPPTTTTSSSSTVPPSTDPPTTRRAGSGTTEGTVAQTTPPTAAPTIPATTQPPFLVEFGPGTYRVGIDLPAGTYRTEGGRYCYWARLSSFSGTADSVIAGEYTDGSPATVTVASSDTGFTTSGCAIWLSA